MSVQNSVQPCAVSRKQIAYLSDNVSVQTTGSFKPAFVDCDE